MFQERARTLEGFALALDGLCICLAFTGALALRALHPSLPLLQMLPAEPWASSYWARSDYAINLAVNLFVWIAYIRRSRIYINGDAGRLACRE